MLGRRQRSKSEDSPIALVTGCSSGIGYELARLLPLEGYRVVATTRKSSFAAMARSPLSRDPMIELAELDLQDYEQGSARVAAIIEAHGHIDLLVNNAGISYRSVVEDMSPEDELQQMTVNYLGPMHLIRECLPHMRRSNRGRIVNISSVGGMMAMPTMASYSASKFALEGATEALWYELKPWNIHVTLLQPGFINSNAFNKVLSSARLRQGQSPLDYAIHYESMSHFIAKLMTRAHSSSASVARSVIKTIRRQNPPLRVAATPDALFFHYLRRLLPRFLYHKLLHRSLPGINQWGRTAHKTP